MGLHKLDWVISHFPHRAFVWLREEQAIRVLLQASFDLSVMMGLVFIFTPLDSIWSRFSICRTERGIWQNEKLANTVVFPFLFADLPAWCLKHAGNGRHIGSHSQGDWPVPTDLAEWISIRWVIHQRQITCSQTNSVLHFACFKTRSQWDYRRWKSIAISQNTILDNFRASGWLSKNQTYKTLSLNICNHFHTVQSDSLQWDIQ